MVESANLAYQTVEDQSSTTDLLVLSFSTIQKLDIIDYVDVEQILKKANIPPSLSIKDRIKCIKKISDNIYQEMISIHLKQTSQIESQNIQVFLRSQMYTTNEDIFM